MNVGERLTDTAGLELIANIWDEIEKIQTDIDCMTCPEGKIRYRLGTVKGIKQTMVYAVHRLTFLEMVVKGMTYQQQHDAQAYAKFVEKKRKLEDLDINELRVLLR